MRGSGTTMLSRVLNIQAKLHVETIWRLLSVVYEAIKENRALTWDPFNERHHEALKVFT